MSTPYTGHRQRYSAFEQDPVRGARFDVHHVRGDDGGEYALKIPLVDGLEEHARERAALQHLALSRPDADAWMVMIVDEGTTPDGRPFVVMPWFPESLLEWVDRVKPDIRQLLRACEGLAWAVERLHERVGGQDEVMLHRHLEPSNVLVRDTTSGLQVVLAYLGRTRDTSGFGAERYGAPEQAIPGTRAVGSAVDVHSLAAITFHLLAGRPRRPLCNADFTPRFLHLTALHRRDTRTPWEQAELDELVRSPIEQLLRLERAPALGHEDREHLERAWTARLSALRLDPSAVSETLRELVDVLEHALEPRPRRRLTEARVVRQTLASVRGRLEQAVADGGEAPPDAAWIAAPVEAAQPAPPPAPASIAPAAAPPPRRRPAKAPRVWAPLVPLVPLVVVAGVALALFAEGGLRLARREPAGQSVVTDPLPVKAAVEPAPAPETAAEPVATRKKLARSLPAEEAEAPALAVSSIQVTVLSTDEAGVRLKRAGREGPAGVRGAFYVGSTPVPVELVAPDGDAPGRLLASLVLQVRRKGSVSSLHVRRDGLDLPPQAVPDGAAAVVRCDVAGCSTGMGE